MQYLDTDRLVSEVLTRAEQAQKQIRAAYFDVHIHPMKPNNPAYAILRALFEAKDRGCAVRFLFPAWNYNNANRRSAFYLQAAGLAVRIMPRHRPLHAKLIIFDRTALILGSHNISKAGLTKNLEASALLTGAEDIRAGQNDFERWWKQSQKIEARV